MGAKIVQPRRSELWSIVARQHGVVTRGQLLALGFSAKAIKHRIGTGRLHAVRQGVYAVGRPRLTQHGRWMAAVLSCGQEAMLSHECAAALLGIRPDRPGPIEVSVPARKRLQRPGIVVHRRAAIRAEEVTQRDGIPVTSPICTLVDIAARIGRGQLEAAINEADKRRLANPEDLRSALGRMPRRPGARALREVLDCQTLTLTDSELERRFLPIARSAGLPAPATQAQVNGFRVDFHWPELGLVVETDGLRYHRTALQQAKDCVRDQAHTAAGLTPLRFTHAQVTHDPGYVRATLAAVARRLVAGET